MKKGLIGILFLIMILMLAACTTSGEDSEKPNTSDESTDFLGFGDEKSDDEKSDDEKSDNEIDYYPLIAMSTENEADTIAITYVDNGVRIDFSGSNEFGAGYAFIPDTNSISGTAEFFEKDNSKEVYVYYGYDYIVISETEENPAVNGISYDRDFSRDLRDIYVSLTSDTPMFWLSDEAEIEDLASGEEEEYYGEIAEMKTSFIDGTLSITLVSTDNSVFTGEITSDLSGEYQFKGKSEEYDIAVVPYRYKLLITLTSKSEIIKLKFDYEDMYYEENSITACHEAPPIVDLDVSYNNVEYTVPCITWTANKHNIEVFDVLQFKNQDGEWITSPYTYHTIYANKIEIDIGHFFEFSENTTSISEIRVASLPRFTDAGDEIYGEDLLKLVDTYNFTKGENWIDCDISLKTEINATQLVVERVSGAEEFTDEENIVRYEINGLRPNLRYSFETYEVYEGGSSSSSTSETSTSDGVLEITDYDSDDDDEFYFVFSTQTTGDIFTDEYLWYELITHIVDIGEAQNGVTPYSVTKEVYTDFYLNTDNVDLEGLELKAPETATTLKNILVSTKYREDTAEVNYEDNYIIIDFTGSNIFGDGYLAMPGTNVIITQMAIYYEDDDSTENPRDIIVNRRGTHNDEVVFYFNYDADNAVTYQIGETWKDAMNKNFFGEEGSTQNWIAVNAGKYAIDINRIVPIDFSNISASSVTQNGEVHFDIYGIDEYFSHTSAIFSGYYEYFYKYEEGALGSDYYSVPFYAFYENDILCVEVGYDDNKVTIEFMKSE